MPKYNSQTMKALDASIKHWKRLSTNSQEPNEAPNWKSCALCCRFLAQDCLGCPIFDKTGKDSCRGTPYRYAFATWCFSNNGPRNDFFRHALDMLNFLLDLRKELSP